MGLSGLVGAGVSDALAEVLERRLKEQIRQQQEQQAADQLALQRDQLASVNADREAQQQEGLRRITLAELKRVDDLRNEATQTAARSDMGNVLQMPGMSPEQINRELAGSSLRTGTEIPRTVIDLMKVPETRRQSVTVPGPNGRPVRKMVTEDELTAGVEEYRAPVREAAEKPSVWVSKGSDMRFVTPTEASRLSGEGWRSGQTREQGRPVVSGDANRVADLDTSLDDLDVLTTTLGDAGTGTVSKVGAMLPNAVTEYTGWGADAKKRQAVIDRVKQVIGKALEGGVLRKEDEAKYEKILPTIYDLPDVAASKLKGLETAIAQRRQTLLDSLADAGYDTSRFNARVRQPKAGTASPGDDDLAELERRRKARKPS